MDPIIGASLISGASSLLSGLFGRNSEKKAIAAQNEYNKPINIRARAEEAGFNPLLFVGPGVGLQTATGGTNYMGAALADAGLALADAMSKKAELGQLEKLTQANKKLAEEVQTLTIRPKVGGVYAQREATPSLRAALGGEDENVSSVSSVASAAAGGGAGANGASPSPLVDGQKLEDEPTPSSTGFMHIRNFMAPDGFFVPGSDGEPLDIWQLPTVLGSYFADKGMRWLDRYSSDGPYLGADISVDRVKPPTPAQTEKLNRQARIRKDMAGRYGW